MFYEKKTTKKLENILSPINQWLWGIVGCMPTWGENVMEDFIVDMI